jgi:hypothetical protein
MKLELNEQEIIDGICVYVADQYDGDPEYVDVKEINYHIGGEFSAIAVYRSKYKKELETENILVGIQSFLERYHSFDPNVTVIELNYTEDEGIWAEAFVNEE